MSQYTINSKDADIERLKILADTYNESSLSILKNAGLAEGMSVLELGCGIGYLTVEIAKYVGEVLVYDISPERLQEAKHYAEKNNIKNINFKLADVTKEIFNKNFDIAYTRALLHHLNSPKTVLKKMIDAVKPGGKVIAEEPDFSSVVHYPVNEYMKKGRALFKKYLTLQDADPNIGFKLPHMFYELGLEDVQVSIKQHVSMSGPLKYTRHITLKAIEETLIKEKFTTEKELVEIIQGMENFIKDKTNLVTRPRFFQVVGTVPTSI